MAKLLLLPAGAVAALSAAAVGMSALGSSGLAASPSTVSIPAAAARTYQAAAATCPGLSWTVLAAIGKIESDHGRSNAPGVHRGENNAGAGGPMQFLASTWSAYGVDADHDGVANRYDFTDAVYGAAHFLCAHGAGNPARLANAVFAYNHDDRYVSAVLQQASVYAGSSAVGTSAAAAIEFAYGQLGKPYQWGAAGPDSFDCSGLTYAAYERAGVRMPRTAEQQWLALPHVDLGDLQPGDLVFFNPGEFVPGLPGHVGIYVGDGNMIDAPHSGSVVGVDQLRTFGHLVGAARPTS